MRNLERKVRCDPGALADARTRLAAVRPDLPEPERLRQVDTYYRVPHGRLKLRRIDRLPTNGDAVPVARTAELIGYDRADDAGSRWSRYHVAALDPASEGAVDESLALALGVLVQVSKRRDVALVGATRVHLDRVDGLGDFIELETVIAGQDDASALREHEAVIALLELDRFTTVAGSYSDLLLRSPAVDS